MNDRTVVVAAGMGGILPRTLKLRDYFTSKEKSGGGVLDLLDVRPDGTALICFRDCDDAAEVESRDHEIDGTTLIVYPFYGELSESGDSGYDNTATLPRARQTQSIAMPSEKDLDLREDSFAPSERELHVLAGRQSKAISWVKTDSDHREDPLEPLETEELNMPSGKMKLLLQSIPMSVQRIVEQFRTCYFLENGIIVTDTSATLAKKIQKLKVALLDVNEETFEMTKPLAYTLLTSKRVEEELKKMEKKLKCVIQIDQGFYSSREEKTETSEELQESLVTLVTGDLVNQEVDVLVSSVSTDLDLLAGSTSSTLLRMGGDALQKDCRRSYPEGIKNKEIATITGGKLKCREIFFICLPELKDDPKLKTLGSMVYKCLYECCERGYTSIAFPALGTGSRGYPVDLVSEVMFQKMTQFLHYTSTIRDVRVVVRSENKVALKAFEENKPSFLNNQNNKDDSDDNPDTEAVVARDDFRVGNLTIHVKQGEIHKDNSQALVNIVSTAQALNAGSSANSLLSACGKDIDHQCRIAVNTLEKKGVALTTAPGLQAEFIVHSAMDHFDGSLKEVTKACLKMADEHRISSIALPCLWRETESMALRNIVKLMVKCFEDFEKKTSTLKEVSLVLQDETDCSIFLSLLEEVITKKKQKSRGRFSYRRRDVTVGTGSKDLTEKISSLKKKLDRMDVYCCIDWSTGFVEMQGLKDNVQELESILQQAN